MEGRCATCRHWQRSHLNHDPSDYGACLITVVMAGGAVRDDAKMWVMTTDESDTQNEWLETSDDFGCIQWEPTA